MDRNLTDPNMISWRSDESNTVGTYSNELGRVKFLTPPHPFHGVSQMVGRNSNLDPVAISFGDFNPWAGDWSIVRGSTNHERRLAAPTSVYWCVGSSVDIASIPTLQSYLELYATMVGYMDKIRAGSITYGATHEVMTVATLFDESLTTLSTVYDNTDGSPVEVGPWVTFPGLMDSIESCLTGLDDMHYYQGDRAKIKVSASPFGGDTHGQIGDVQATLNLASSNPTSALPLHNYTVIGTLPSYGSADTISVSGGLDVCDAIYAWESTTWTPDAESSEVDDKIIAGGKAALDDILANASLGTLTFPLFVNKCDDSGQFGTLSYYQPHLLPNGDNMSAKVLAAAGGYVAPNGFLSSSQMQDLAVTSAGMPLSLPDVNASHSVWIDGAKIGYVGTYGIEDPDRPWHNTVVDVVPSISAAYRAEKLSGDGSFSFGLQGYGYNAVPLTPGDWPVVNIHCNPKLRFAMGQTYSLWHSSFTTGGKTALEVCNLTQPYMAFQWEDHGGVGPALSSGTDLKGYRYKYSRPDLTTAKAARMDSRKGNSGYKTSPIFHLPYVRDKFKLWTSEVDTYGVQTTAGRFDAISANDTGLLETVGGALFTQRPDLSMNLYCNWTAEDPKQVIGRFTVKVI